MQPDQLGKLGTQSKKGSATGARRLLVQQRSGVGTNWRLFLTGAAASPLIAKIAVGAAVVAVAVCIFQVVRGA
jgi:hypothetical protein